MFAPPLSTDAERGLGRGRTRDPGEIAYAGHETFALSEISTSRTFVTTLATHVRVEGTDCTFLTIREVAH